MRYAVLVAGPAGSGKSTFCTALLTHLATMKRTAHLFNLDPAIGPSEYHVQPTIDIRELISLEDVMEEMQLGPNGGLVYCFEYLLQNLDWLDDEIGDYDNDYIIIDCPGQIELYTHHPLLPKLISHLSIQSIRICAVYLLESQFMEDRSKFFAGVMSAMSAMVNLEVPHLNLISKMDLVSKKGGKNTGMRKALIDRYMEADPLLLVDEPHSRTNPKFHGLSQAIVQLIEDHNMVQFLPLDVTDEDSLQGILEHIDYMLQYGEDEEPKEVRLLSPNDLSSPDHFAA
ncbi:hypothetical protein CALVIDRAFT_546743 [Calocera viscosa TUFC12733]|uniref:GPN-loop GTPase 3 n=1 Tax=Calocera viscosa (strain TUFC12733) TaxID=1330018 RepID=A0A167J5Z5_CALVF|nr:hypothetical protein CALVIDRAFT_546743 [Calocera viscosa TUFC12733]